MGSYMIKYLTIVLTLLYINCYSECGDSDTKAEAINNQAKADKEWQNKTLTNNWHYRLKYLKYYKDERTGICFAQNWTNPLTITCVPCEKIPDSLLIK